jgi:hypothetical protein
LGAALRRSLKKPADCALAAVKRLGRPLLIERSAAGRRDAPADWGRGVA